MRFFVRVRDNPKAGNYGQPLSLHRFSEDGKTSQFWSRENERWEFSPGTIGFTGLGGGTDLFEVDPVRAYTVFVGVLGGDPETAQSVLGIRLPEEALASGTVSGLASGTAVEEFDSPPTGTASAQAAEVEVRGVLRRVFRHYGPGAHPGTGTEQQVHAGGGGQAARIAKPLSEEDAIHVFEQAGLGKGPYRFVGYWQMPSKALLEANPNAYNAAFAMAPKSDYGGHGSCNYCGTPISAHCLIKSADGKHFFVGSECVNKTGDEGLTSKLKAAQRQARHQRERERAKGQAWQLINLLARDDVREALSKEPHPNDYFAKKGRTLFDYYGYFTGPGMSLSKSKWILGELAEMGFEAGEGVEGDWEQISGKIKVRHYGPGPHPGTGTEQEVHAGGGGRPFLLSTWGLDEMEARRRITAYLDDNFPIVSTARNGVGFMDREGRLYDTGVGVHNSAARTALEATGLWAALGKRKVEDQRFNPVDLVLSLGFGRYRDFGSTLAFETGGLDNITPDQRAAMQTHVQVALDRGSAVILEPHGGMGVSDAIEGDDLRDFLGLTVRHYGPGPHPGTGTDQAVHGGDGGEAYKIGEAISTVDAIAAARKDPNVVRDAFGAARFAQAIKSVEDGFRGEDGHSNSRVRGVIRRGEREARPRSPAYPERFFGGHDYWILANGDAVIVDSHDISASEAIAGLEWFSLLPKGWTTSDVTPEGLMAAMGLVRYSTSGTRGIQVGPRKMTDEQTETISAMLANVNSVENMQWNTVVPFVAGNTLGMANGDDGVGLADLLRVRHYGPGPHPGTGT